MLHKASSLTWTVFGSLILICASLPAHAQTTATCDGRPATIIGTPGNDTLMGTDGPDVIAGLEGDDTISGLGGDDIICAGAGNDTVYGEAERNPPIGSSIGNDRIFGEGGADTLMGDFHSADFMTVVQSGRDYIDGGTHADVIAGFGIDLRFSNVNSTITFADETLIGGDGADTIYGVSKTVTFGGGMVIVIGGSNDTIQGGLGTDQLYGDFETLTANEGATIRVSGFRDTLSGGGGADVIYGDTKNSDKLITPEETGTKDIINGGEGTDNVNAGPGLDTCTGAETAVSCGS